MPRARDRHRHIYDARAIASRILNYQLAHSVSQKGENNNQKTLILPKSNLSHIYMWIVLSSPRQIPNI